MITAENVHRGSQLLKRLGELRKAAELTDGKPMKRGIGKGNTLTIGRKEGSPEYDIGLKIEIEDAPLHRMFQGMIQDVERELTNLGITDFTD